MTIKILSLSIISILTANAAFAEQPAVQLLETKALVNEAEVIGTAKKQDSVEPQSSQNDNLQQQLEKNNQDLSKIDETLQRVEGKVDGLDEKVNLSNQALVEQPLGDKTQGIEINMFRFLTMGLDGESSFSGSYSWFDTTNNVEIALPVLYSSSDYDIDGSNKSIDSFNLDLHYRKYMGHRLDGFYLAGFARYTYLSGIKGNEYDDFFSESSESSISSENKFGIGVGIGYRIMSRSGFYWGSSISVGRYVIGDAEQFDTTDSISAAMDDRDVIFDVEFFKFGFAF